MLDTGHARLMMMLPGGHVLVRFVRSGNRSHHHPVVVRAAIEHGRRREALEGQREQQQPHHYGTKAEYHSESVEGFC